MSMAIRIPESPRVIYASNPLVDVICQVRFPRILRIDSELPVAFQEAIRSRFPHFVETVVELQGLPHELAAASPRQTKVYAFESEDRSWKVTLTSEFIALSTSRYERWESFVAALGGPLEALYATYQPAFASRIGLRYIDVILRSGLGLSDVPWSDLVKPWVLGDAIHLVDDEADVLGAARDVLIQLEGGARMRLRHGFARRGPDGGGEVGYRIDTDFYIENDPSYRSSGAVLEALQRFNGQSGRLFRHMIQPRLHVAMGPDEVS